jgi:hypothetical protein
MRIRTSIAMLVIGASLAAAPAAVGSATQTKQCTPIASDGIQRVLVKPRVSCATATALERYTVHHELLGPVHVNGKSWRPRFVYDCVSGAGLNCSGVYNGAAVGWWTTGDTSGEPSIYVFYGYGFQ